MKSPAAALFLCVTLFFLSSSCYGNTTSVSAKDVLHRQLFCEKCTSGGGFFADLDLSYISVSSTMKYHNLKWICVDNYTRSYHWIFMVGYSSTTNCERNIISSLLGHGGVYTRLFAELKFQTLKVQYDLRNCTQNIRVDFPKQFYPPSVIGKYKVDLSAPGSSTSTPFFKTKNELLLNNYTWNARNNTANFLA